MHELDSIPGSLCCPPTALPVCTVAVRGASKVDLPSTAGVLARLPTAPGRAEQALENAILLLVYVSANVI